MCTNRLETATPFAMLTFAMFTPLAVATAKATAMARAKATAAATDTTAKEMPMAVLRPTD